MVQMLYAFLNWTKIIQVKMTEAQIEELALFDHREILLPQQQVANELNSSLQKFIAAEVNKFSTKMTESSVNFCNDRIALWRIHMENIQQKLRDFESLITFQQNENDKLQKQLAKCTTTIENQRKNIAEQQNILINKTKRIESLETCLRAAHKTTQEQNQKIIRYEKQIKSYD